jgi:acyl-CoA synthetase (AMP-forming)/AMP-acid ligase II/alkylation response protein AidB-like acyl-CoA dehydrogenase/acyl carrier protein
MPSDNRERVPGVVQMDSFVTFTAVLDGRAALNRDKIAYTFLANGEVEAERITFGELQQRALAVAARLIWLNARGQRALLVYPQGLEFIVAFFGCLYAGVIAVPVSLPNRKRGIETLRRVATDAGANWLLSAGSLLEQLASELASGPSLHGMTFMDTAGRLSEETAPPAPRIAPTHIALLQYTSGSSGSPRGVIVTHANLVDNQRQIARSFAHDENTVAVSWLPMFHDMGLGTVLGAAWVGCHCVLMSPQAFLQNPARWLEAIARYRATSSGGPDFAYDLCARRISSEQRKMLDLTSWTVAYNGSEPVRAATLERFSEAFACVGFRSSAFQAVYGLAEATLLVTSESVHNEPVLQRFSSEGLELGQAAPVASSSGQALVGCGRPAPSMTLKIVDPESRVVCRDGEIGEIWVSGASVAKGYWGKESETESTFRATLPGEGTQFLRTGDLGFLSRGELFVTGRRKDLIIIRGRNHYPQDLEDSVSAAHAALVPLACAAFSIESEQGEVLVIVQEVARSAIRTLDASRVVRAIRGAISAHHGLHTHAVVLLKPSTLPRTSSGKVRRKACRDAFLSHSLPALAAWVSPLSPTPDAEPEPNSERRECTARADRLIDWLRRHAADLINAQIPEGPQGRPPALLLDLAKQGLSGMQVEVQYGGLGLANSDAVRVLEQLAAIDFALAIFVGLNNSLGIQPIAKYGGSRLKALLLPELSHGVELAAFAFEEPTGGSRTGGVSVEARADGEDRWRLFGTKYLDGVAHGASVINVFARHEEPPGISAFTVSEEPDGLRQVRDGLSMGLRGFARDTIALHGVQVSRDNLLGSLGSGLEIAREAMSHTRLAIAAACIGGMKRCAQWVGREGPYQQSIDGNLTPNPVTLSRLGSVTASITALECLVHRIAQALDAGYAVPSEAFAACKIQGPEMLLRCVDDVMQLGVSGASAEMNRLSCLHRDAGFLRIFAGSPEAVAELTGAAVMADDSSLRRLIEEALHAPGVSIRIDAALSAVKKRMLQLRGALASRAERWGHTRAGELTAWLVLLAAVEGSRGPARDVQELNRAHAWALAQFEQTLVAVRVGTPSETATLTSSDVAATFAAYARTIGELERQPKPQAPEPRPIGPTRDSVVPASDAPPGETPSRTARTRELSAWVSAWLARRLQTGVPEIESVRSFADHGLDSVAAVELAKALSDKLGRELDETLLWSFPTIDALVRYVVDVEQPGTSAAPKTAAAAARESQQDGPLDDEIARLERELRHRT